MGNPYQLFTKDFRVNGSYFFVNGPYDKHGFVMSSKPHIDKFGNKGYLNFVRGTGNIKTTGANYNKEKPIIFKEQKTTMGYDYKAIQKLIEGNKLKLTTHRGGYRLFEVIENTEEYIKLTNHTNKTHFKIIKGE